MAFVERLVDSCDLGHEQMRMQWYGKMVTSKQVIVEGIGQMNQVMFGEHSVIVQQTKAIKDAFRLRN